MISIQELGLSILSDSPKQLYILGGTDLYKGEKYEYPDVMSVINMMNTRHLIPLKPALYVVRYDESFVSALNEAVALKLKSTKICGTLVCIYSDTRHVAKLDKFLSEYVSQLDAVNPRFIAKYLKQDFPGLEDRYIQLAVKCGTNYGHSRTICKSLSTANKELISKMKDSSLEHLFGCSNEAADAEIRLGVASRNFKYLCKALSAYEGDKDSLYYVVLQTMIDMEKLLTAKYFDTDIKEYKKLWKLQDVYYMFMHTYDVLSKSRSSTVSATTESNLIYLFALLTFKDIPSLEVLHDF